MPTYIDDYLDSLAPSRPRRRRSAGTAEPFDLTPEQTTSLLGRVGGSAMSGLSATANVLDLPGSSVRDVVGLLGGGSWDKYNPFDQWLDPTGRNAAENRVTGRDLLRGGGLIGEKDTWANFLLGELPVSIATDPLMYLPPFGLTKAGLLAKQTGQLGKAAGVATAKAGTRVGPLKAALKTTLGELPEFSMASRPFTAATDEALTKTAQKAGVGVEDLLQQPLRKGVGVHIPFVGNVGGFNPPGAERVAGGLDWLGNALATSAPGRVVKGLFHAPAGNQFTTEGQQLAESIFDAKRETVPQIAAANRETHELLAPALSEIESQLGPDIIGAARKRILDPAEANLDRIRATMPARAATLPLTDPSVLSAITSSPLANTKSINKSLAFDIGGRVELAIPTGGQRKIGELVIGQDVDLAKSIANTVRANAKGGFSSGFHNARVVDTPHGAVVKWGSKDPAESVIHTGSVGNQKLLNKATKAFNRAKDEFETLDHAAEISRVSDKLLRGAGEKSAKETLDLLGIDLIGDTTPLTGPKRQQVSQMMQDTFGADSGAGQALLDARAKAWASQAGKDADDYFDRFMDIRKGAPEDVGQGALFQDGGGFYSQLGKVIDDKIPNNVSHEQLMGTLNKAGVKKEELELAELSGLFEGRKSVPKEELKAWADAHSVKLEETVLGSDSGKLDEYLNQLHAEGFYVADGIPAQDAARELAEQLKYEASTLDDSAKIGELTTVAGRLEEMLYAGGGDTKFHGYTTPGGENYREVLLRLPSKFDQDITELNRLDNMRSVDMTPAERTRYSELTSTLGDNHSRADMMTQGTYTSPHWDEPNVLAHIRMSDRVGPKGEKILHVEEIQSDWHQAGRKKGYKDPQLERRDAEIRSELKPIETRLSEINKTRDQLEASSPAEYKQYIDQVRDEYISLRDKRTSLFQQLNEMPKAGTIPDAPFKSTEAWMGLGMKRVLKEAVEGGYEKVTFTTGAEQAARYDLSRQVKEIEYVPIKSGDETAYSLGVQTIDGEGLDLPKQLYKADELEDVVGKEIAQKIVNGEGKKYRGHDGYTLEGGDLKVGGEGMKGFYDKMLPSYVNKYAKKWGAKVREGRLGDDLPVSTDGRFSVGRNEATGTYHVLDNGKPFLENLDSAEDATRALSGIYDVVDSQGKSLGEGPWFDADEAKAFLDDEVGTPGAKVVAAGGESGTKVHEFDITPAMRDDILGKGQPLFQGGKGAGAKGAVEFSEDGKAIITAFKGADVSTMAHEIGHVFRRDLIESSPDLLKQVEKEYGIADGVWGRPHEERFATDFEKYLSDGKAPNQHLKTVFAKFKDWLTTIYRSIVGTPLENSVSPKMKEVFDRLLQDHSKLDNVDDAIGKVIKSNKDEMAALEGMGFDLKYLDEDRLNHLHRSVPHSQNSYLDKKAIDSALASEATMMGVSVDKLPPAVVRRVTEEVAPKSARKLLNTKTVVDTSRDTATRHLPTELVNKLLVDPQLRTAANTTAGQTQAAQHILDTIPEFLDPTYVSQSKPSVAWDVARWAEKNRGVPGFTDKFDQQIARLNSPQAEHAIAQHADDLAAYIRRHPRREMYTNTTMADQTRYRAGLELKKATGNAVHNFLRESASKEGDVALTEAFQAAGMNPEKSLEYFAKQAGIDIGEASQLRVSQQTANAVSSVLSVAKAPAEWAQKIGNVFDSVNNALRAPLTVIWPAFHTRNSASGQFINMTTGLMQTPADFKLYADSLLESAKLAKLAKRGGDSPLLRELVDYEEIIFGKGGRGVAGEHLVHGKTFQDISLDAAELPEVLNRIPGVKQVSKGYSKLLKAGGKAMEKVEFSNRAPLYVYLRKKGWSPLQAAIEVEKRHFDYSQLSSFERNVMKRAGLFYSFSRRMAPLVMETLATKPGGAMAQTIKAFGKSSGQDERPVPKYIRDQSAAFLGELPGGSLRYLTGLGLPHEDTFSLAGEPIKELLSRTTPLIKAPAELAFGESLFQKGRALEDLDPGIGRILANIGQLRDEPSRILRGGEPVNVDPVRLPHSLEFLVANSPLSRTVSSVRTATDPRKGLAAKALNLLTGAKISDVSPASQDAILREAAAAAMKRLGGKTFVRTYIPSDRKEKLSEQDQMDALMLDSLMKELARRTKERKVQK